MFYGLNAKIDNKDISLCPLKNEIERKHGYQFVKSPPTNTQGLLFVFDDVDSRVFHMNNVSFDLDLLGFDEEQNLIFVIPMKSKSEKTYKTPPCKFCIEVIGGWADTLQTKKCKVQFLKPGSSEPLSTMTKSNITKEQVRQQIKNLVVEEIEKIRYGKTLSEGARFHIENKITINNNIFRPTTDKFFNLFLEMKNLWKENKYTPTTEEIELLETDIGEFGYYNEHLVPLDCPMIVEDDLEINEAEYKGKEVKLNKPKRGGSKKFYVYVKCGDRVKKVSFGSPDMPLRISEPERRKSFVARHNCKEKNDKCSAGYWSCRIGRYPHLTGAKKAYAWW